MRNQSKENSKAKETILGIIVIIILIVFAVFVLFWLGRFILKFLEGLSKLDAVVIVALITGSISLIVAIVSKYIDYTSSRKQYLAQKREKPYEDFITMVYKVQRNIKDPNSYSNEEMIADVKEFSEALTLWGSKNVAEKWVKFRLNSNDNNSAENILFILEDILNEMRTDMGVKRLKKGTLLSFFVNDIDKEK